MSDPVRLAIVGCGGMGRRHLTGLGELRRGSHANVQLVAVCDPNLDNAAFLAREAEQLLGTRPAVFDGAAAMVAAGLGVEAADCTTDTGSHHRVATELFELGLHVMCEKPLAVTVRGCLRVIEAARRAGRVLSVAENFRRDPINRLVRALIDGGAIGAPQFLLEASIGGRDDILITPWRHMRMTGAMPLDAGVHNADILQFYFGPALSAYGVARLFEKRRHKRGTAGPGGFYERWADSVPDEIEPDGEDAVFGTIVFENGAVGQLVQHHAGHGLRHGERLVYGTRGSIVSPGDRNGRPVRLTLDDGTDVADERVLEFAPGYRLSPVAAELFGSERPWTYDLDFNATDRRILALEYHELGECVRGRAAPEVDGAAALRAVALIYALIESERAGRPVTLAEVREGAVDGYQRDMDEQLGLVG
jgi:predicted dehydrogenase